MGRELERSKWGEEFLFKEQTAHAVQRLECWKRRMEWFSWVNVDDSLGSLELIVPMKFVNDS